MGDSFYAILDEDVFRPSDFTVGPWTRDAQHGGPPAALLGRAIESEAGKDKQVVRIVFDILGPVPIEPLTIETTTVRPGKKVSLIEATLRAERSIVMRASAWVMRMAEMELPDPPVDEPQTSPDHYEAMDPSIVVPPTSYLHGTEWRFVSGSFLEPGPAIAWIRTRVPLIGGEEDSPLTKVLAVADSASGVSGALDFRKWLYINTDLSVYLHRMPRGPWVKIDAVTTIEPTGVAIASARLYDERGSIGTSSQALYIAPR